VFAAQKANDSLGCIESSMASRSREGNLHLCRGIWTDWIDGLRPTV